MSRKLILALVATLGLSTTAFAAHDFQANAGVVQVDTCFKSTKYGVKENSEFDQARRFLESGLQAQGLELKAISEKLEDVDYMDSLSKEAEQELRMKMAQLNQEFHYARNVYFEKVQNAQAELQQRLLAQVNAAVSEVAKKKNLTLVVVKEQCLFTGTKLDITDDVIKVMDKSFDANEKGAVELPATK